MKILLPIFVALSISAICTDGFSAPPPEIRVQVIEDAAAVKVDGGKSELRIITANSRNATTIGTYAMISAGEGELTLNGVPFGKEIAMSNAYQEYTVADRRFTGGVTAIWKSAGRMMLINTLPLERYLVGLVGSEISPAWPSDAIKAQVVAARTYAQSRIDGIRKSRALVPYDIMSTIMSQVYHGAHVEDTAAFSAVDSTRGEVLYRNGAPFTAFYHSCCGGKTEHAHNAWKGSIGPPVIEDKFCSRSPKFKWSYSMPASEFASKLKGAGIPIGKVSSIATSQLSDSPRVDLILIEDENGLTTVEATELRRILGYKEVKSTWFEISMNGNKINFTGRGYGHGVGMCQWGAKQMAEEGIGYIDILKFYYPDSEVRKLY